MSRDHSWVDDQERLSRMVAYLHDHLSEPLDLNRLAEVAHLPVFEAYLNNPRDTAPANLLTDIHLPLAETTRGV